jgi:chemotaxis protein methyltransferase CheR
MSESKTQINMSQQQFEKLRKIIYDRAGIHFPDAKKYVLESRLTRRLEELEIEDYDQYISFLSIGPYRDDEFQEMFNKITINETSFFRNEPQLDIFEKHSLSKLLEARSRDKRLRLWSAACSTGEEPYTLAMQVHRSLGLRLPDWRVEILGTDISEKVLTEAASGRYTDYSMRTTPQLVKQRYFKQDGPFWTLDPTVRSMVNFDHHNLKDKLAAKRYGKWDVIFCRNVMIYFDDAMKQQVINTFAEQLADDGWLFIGHSETLRGLDVPFEQVNLPQGFCYQKKKAVTTDKPATTSAFGVSGFGAKPASPTTGATTPPLKLT